MRDIDPELEKLWFEARERQLGFLSPYSFDVPGGAAASSEAIESLTSNRSKKNCWVASGLWLPSIRSAVKFRLVFLLSCLCWDGLDHQQERHPQL